jgi:hypothetical protein
VNFNKQLGGLARIAIKSADQGNTNSNIKTIHASKVQELICLKSLISNWYFTLFFLDELIGISLLKGR